MTRCSATRRFEQELSSRVDPLEVGGGEEAARDQDIGPARPPERPAGPSERLHVAEPARAVLQVGFEHLCDRTGTQASDLGGIRQRAQDPFVAPLGQLADLLLELGGQRGVTREVPHLEQRGERVEIVVGERRPTPSPCGRRDP